MWYEALEEKEKAEPEEEREDATDDYSMDMIISQQQRATQTSITYFFGLFQLKCFYYKIKLSFVKIKLFCDIFPATMKLATFNPHDF